MPLSNGYNLGLLVDGVEGEEHYIDLMKQWRGLDALVQAVVQDKDRTAPPTDIVDGQVYIIPVGATGAWAGRTNSLARGFTIGTGAPGWQYFQPKKGWSVMVLDEGDMNGVPLEYRYTGTAWAKPDLGPTREEVLANPMTNLGDIIFGDSEANPARLPIGAELQVLTAVDGVPVWRDPTVSGGGGDGMTNPMLVSQDIIVAGDSGVPTRLAKGAESYSLQIIGGLVKWGPQSGSGGGGMTNPMLAAGDLIYGGADGVPTRLVKGADGQVLKLTGGLPAWGEDLVGTGGGMTNPMTAARDMIIGGTGGTPIRVANGTAGQLWSSNGWVTLPTYVLASTLGVTVATLDGSGKVPAAQLPSYVDDVLEFNTLASFPYPGEAGKIYVALNTNKQYRFPDGGSDYVELVASPGTTDNVPEGTVNKYWTAARTLAQVLTGFVTTNNAAVVAGDTIVQAFGKLQAQLANFATKGVNSNITSLTGIVSNFVAAATGVVLGSAAVPWAQLFLGTLTMSGAVNNAPQVTLASAATVDIGAAASNSVIITGTTDIGSLGAVSSATAGMQRFVRFTGALNLYHSSALVLPGATNLLTRANDTAIFEATATAWRMTQFMRADGSLTMISGFNNAPQVTVASAGNLNLETVPANTVRISGTAYIGNIGSLPAGSRRRLIFDGAAFLAASSVLVLPNGANVAAEVGDVAELECFAGSVWILVDYFRASGQPFIGSVARKNYLLNPLFNVNQRGYVSGTATTSAQQYTYDRWKVWTSGQAMSVSGVVATMPTGGAVQVVQGTDLLTATYTLSWVGSGTATIDGNAVPNGGTVNLTRGNNASVAFFGQVSFPKLELGTSKTAFMPNTYSEDLWLCQAYYERVKGTVTGGNNAFMQYKFSNTKRVTPTMSLASGSLMGTTFDASGMSLEGFRTAGTPSGSNDFVAIATAEI